jgi:phage tail sheath protein FI
MATALRTPGVYIVEKNAFPNSVVEVPTAVPAFIGYTKYALNGTKSLHLQPFRITSLADFHQHFGDGPDYTFNVTAEADKTKADTVLGGSGYKIEQDKGKFLLYRCIRMFFDNGGGPCYIVSVGDFDGDEGKDTTIDIADFEKGLDTLVREQEPTMVVVPDLMAIAADPDKTSTNGKDLYTFQGKIIDHCGGRMQSRFAVLDVQFGWLTPNSPIAEPINLFRNYVSSDFLKFGAAYYPWVYTSIVGANDVNYRNVANGADLVTMIKAEIDKNVADKKISEAKATEFKTEVDKIVAPDQKPKDITVLHNTLQVISPIYVSLIGELRKRLNLLPPAAAMAGVYSRVDNSRGVWKAPANVTMASVVSPAVNLTSEDQEDLNVTLQGKSINAIRSFIGEGTLVWGARTLDGNSQDWRYINVRRTMIMLEQSIKAACKAYVFEPNNSNTWVAVKSMISNYLTSKWKDGALVGAKPDEAYDVQVGLGSTMTAEEILDGIMNVTVKVAIVRPAEFIVITFQQQMQKS